MEPIEKNFCTESILSSGPIKHTAILVNQNKYYKRLKTVF